MFIYLGAPLGQVWVHDPWCDLAILRISNICKPPPKQFSGLRSKKYWVWQYDIWWFWTSRLNVSSKELDDAEKKDINPPRKKIENNVGNCHKPTMGMVFFGTHNNGDDLGMIYGIGFTTSIQKGTPPSQSPNPLVAFLKRHATETCQRVPASVPFRCLWRISSIRWTS